MKKLFLSILVFICFIATSYAQYPNGTQFLGTDSNVVRARGGLQGRYIPVPYVDTAAANLDRIRQYPGALIFTTSDENYWYRNLATTQWLLSTAINSTAITNYFQLNDSTLVFCNQFNVCDTIVVSGGNVQNFYFLNDSSIVVCDTTNVQCIGDECTITTVCDTIPIPKVSTYIFQNGVREISPYIVEFGSSAELFNASVSQFLQHNTWLNTGYYNFGITGLPLWGFPLNVHQFQPARFSPGIASFKSRGSEGQDEKLDSENKVKLGIQYFTSPWQSTPEFYTGYYDTAQGYAITVNMNGRSAYGMQADTGTSKYGGILIHTFDTTNRDAITFFGQPPPGNNLFAKIAESETLAPSSILTLQNNGNARWYAYPNSRNDGVLTKALGTDANGNMLLGTIAGGSGSYVEIVNDSTILVCNVDNVCDTFVVEGVDVQNVYIVNDTLLLVCNSDDTICDTLIIPTASFDRGFFDPPQASIQNVTHNSNGYNFGVKSIDSLVLGANTYLLDESGIPFSTANTLRFLALDTVTGRVYRTSGITGITADNGLTANTATNVRLGGTLLANTSIDATALYNMAFTGANTGFTNGVLNVTNTAVTTAVAIKATSNASNSIAVYALSTSGAAFYGTGNYGLQVVGTTAGVDAQSTSGIAVQGQSTSSFGGYFSVNPASTATVVDVMAVNRFSTGTAADGIGGTIRFNTQSSTGTAQLSNQLISKWTTANNATRTSQFIITGVNSGTTGDILTLNGNKSIRANGYGAGTFSGTAAYCLAVDASGNVIEVACGGGGGVESVNSGTGITVDNTDPANPVINLTGSVTFGFSVATAAATSNYTISGNNYIILSDLTGQANRTVTLPGSPGTGDMVVIHNKNTAGSGFSWSFVGTVKDFANNTVSTVSNVTVYQIVYDGTNWQIIN